MPNQNRLQLERRNTVVRRLEHIVSAPHIRVDAALIDLSDVARMVDAAAHRPLGAFRLVIVAGHQTAGAGIQPQAQLTQLRLFTGGRVDQDRLIARHRTPHRADLDRHTRRVRHLDRGFGLPEAVADRLTPRLRDRIDHYGVERLTRGNQLLRRVRQARQISLDQHAPHGWRCAETRDRLLRHVLHQLDRIETIIVIDVHSCFADPRRENIRPRMLTPARGGHVQMHIARLNPDPIHRG